MPPTLGTMHIGAPWTHVLFHSSRRDASSDDTSKRVTSTSSEAKTRQERVKQARAMANRGRNKLSELWHRYGYIFLGTYLSIYLGALGGGFAVFHSGLIPPEMIIGDTNVAIEKLVKFIRSHDSLLFAEPYLHTIQDTPAVTNLTLAWIATKLTEPLRALITVAITPRLARLAGRVPADDEKGAERAS